MTAPGDTPPEEFRRQLHELADWLADFRRNLGSLRVAPNDKPGALLAALPADLAEDAEPSVRKRGLVGAGAPVFRIYASEQAHSSAEKAAIALGLGEENVQRVPTDAQFCMDPSVLREIVAHDVASRGRGIKPLAVIA